MEAAILAAIYDLEEMTEAEPEEVLQFVDKIDNALIPNGAN